MKKLLMNSQPLVSEGGEAMDKARKWFRIAELERLSGTSRRTIHFYLQEGLLHPPVKTGKTMAYYDEAHLQKLTYIRGTKRQGLPLFAIREKIAEMDRDGDFAPGRQGGSADVSRVPDRRKKLPQKERGRKTRERILEVGCDLFRQYGYKGTKISDITRELNIGKGTFYFYFSDKKELLLECVPRIFEELFSRGWVKIRQEKDVVKRLEMRAETVLPSLQEFCAILHLSKEALDEDDPKLKQLGKQAYLSIRKPLEMDIEKAVEQGVFRPVDARIAGTVMIGIMEGVYYLQKIDNQLPIEEIVDGVLGLFAAAMRNTRGPDSER